MARSGDWDGEELEPEIETNSGLEPERIEYLFDGDKEYDMLEYCEECDAETDHWAGLEIIEESPDEQDSVHSKEPYRLTECGECSYRKATRMNI